MYELMGKLQLRDLTKKQLERELEKEEYLYDQVVSTLSKAKQERRQHAKELAKEKKGKLAEITEVENTLELARAQKSHMLSKIDDL